MLYKFVLVSFVALAVLLVGGVAAAEDLDVQGSITADQLVKLDSGDTRTLDFGKGQSSIYDNGDLHVVTDDTLYVEAPTVSVSGRLDVSKDLYAYYPIYAQGDLLKFGGMSTPTVDFNKGASKIYDNGNLTLVTDDNLVIDATTLAVNRDLNVVRNSRLQGNVAFTQTGGTSAKPNFQTSGYTLFGGTVDFSGATTVGLANGSSSTAGFDVGTDLTVTSGARIGTGSTPNDITALADDTLFVEGAAEFDGALYVDGAVDLDSTVNVAGASTLTGAVTSATDVTANLGGAEKFIIQADSAPTDDMLTVSNTGFARTGTSGSAIQVNFVQGEITGTDTHSAVLIGASTTSTDDTLFGLEIDAMSGTAGTQTAFLIDSGWDSDLQFADDSPIVKLSGTTPTLTFNDGTNTLMTLADGGTTGNLTASGTITAGTDLTVTSGMRVGTGSTPGAFTALADDSLFVEGQLEVDGTSRLDGVVTVSGSADGTDALVVTAGDILVTNGDLDLSGGDFNVVLDAADTASITNSAATADSLLVTNTGVGSDGITIALTQSDDADNTDTTAGVRVTGTSSSTDADEFYGITFDNLTGGTALETAMHFGTGWDEEILFEDTSPFITMANTGILKFRDDASNVLLTVRDDGTSVLLYGDSAGTGKLGGNNSEWSEIYLGDDAGLNLGLDTDALLAYDNTTDARTELTGTGASLYIEDELHLGRQTLTMSTAGVASETLTPTASYVEVTGQDQATDDVSISTTGAKEGEILIITNLSATTVLINSEATTKIAGGADVSLTQYDVIALVFDGTNWLQMASVAANS